MSQTESEAEKKRKRSDKSSLSEVESPKSELSSSKEKKQSKKKSKIAKQVTPENLKVKEVTEETEVGKMDEIRSELKHINKKLTNVLTKDDPILEKIIKETFKNIKEELLKSVYHRIDILEHSLMEKQIENDCLKKSIKELEIKVEEKQESFFKLKREIENMNKNFQEQLNEQEQYSRRNNIRIDGVEEKENENADETASIVIDTIEKHMKEIKLKKTDIDIAHRVGKKRVANLAKL